MVVLIDLPAFGCPTRLVWYKRGQLCLDIDCTVRLFTEEGARVGAPHMFVSNRAGRRVTEQIGRFAWSALELARELGCNWNTVNDAVVAYGETLVDIPGRFGAVEVLRLDEVIYARRGPFHRQVFSTSITDMGTDRLLDVVPGHSGRGAREWLEA